MIEVVPSADVDVIDAAARGTSEGLHLALNVGALLIAFVSLVYLVNWGFEAALGRATEAGLATDAEAALAGAAPGDEAFAEAGRLAAAAASPVSDVRGPEEYKRHMVDVYVRRGLATAFGVGRRTTGRFGRTVDAGGGAFARCASLRSPAQRASTT